MLYGYIRINEEKGQLLEKINILEKEKCDKILYDSSSTYSNKRPNLRNLLSLIEEGDTIVVESLINFSREIIDCGNIVEEILKKGGSVKVLDLGIIDNKIENKKIIDTFRCMVQFKKDALIENATIGKIIAKKNKDFKDGRPKKYTKKQLDHALSLLAVNGGDLSYNEVSQLTKISKSTLIREVKKSR
ncbi:hypothetical protein HMPREF1092_02186 [Clostridium thermobutyricum]|uniref:Resolvase/invertase-type recombinase catalytic domain-containing protein n=1 Tax=Clostridium thermobutyricum TaxID=29372 RepID=N9XZJ2_9CLOT|nr:recombinase family protein [Clostridium thermobutyricum]ENZ01017.1 hypothetical protein HMPREF1092_02186 [Clostridium thermobutyricum]